MAIRLLIADDHTAVRAGLRSLLKHTNIDLVAEATGGDEAVRLAGEIQPDVVLLDVRMSRGDGLAALTRIKIEHPKMPVLMFPIGHELARWSPRTSAAVFCCLWLVLAAVHQNLAFIFL